jgi:hypothetical protein
MSNRDQKLTDEGWERRSVTDLARLDEIVELYELLDFEVHLEPMTQDLLTTIGENCGSCFSGTWGNFKVVYTKEK